MDSLPTPGTAFLSSLLDFEDDTEKVLQNNNPGAQYAPIQQQSPPTSETKNASEISTGSAEAVPAEDYSLFQQEIERRFREARESARAPKVPKVIEQEQILSTTVVISQVIEPEARAGIPLPGYSQADFDFSMSFSSTPISPVDSAVPEPSMMDFETMFSHPLEGVGFEYRSPFSQDTIQESPEPVAEANKKRPCPAAPSNDSALASEPKKPKGALRKDGKPRARRALSESQVKQKRESFLERNRVAAMKCRLKRKDVVQQLHDDMRLRSEQNAELRIMHQELMEEVESLKEMLGKCKDTQNKDADDNERMSETEGISDKEKMAFMDVLIKEGPRRIG